MAGLIIVSACLVGVNCRYDGSNRIDPKLLALLGKNCVVPICPEQLGGLPTPRNSAKIQGGDGFDVLDSRSRVVDMEGNNVTPQFLKGANEVFNIAKLVGANRAILKDRSPSCGVNHIREDAGLREGVGVLTALLINNKVEVSSENTLIV